MPGTLASGKTWRRLPWGGLPLPRYPVPVATAGGAASCRRAGQAVVVWAQAIPFPPGVSPPVAFCPRVPWARPGTWGWLFPAGKEVW